MFHAIKLIYERFMKREEDRAPDGPTVSRVKGQLGYLFEERPEMAGASAAELARWLSREDRLVLGSRTRWGAPRRSKPPQSSSRSE